jgi:hypothetical protein
MNSNLRVSIINTAVGVVMGYTMMTLIDLDRPVLGILVLAASLIEMINNLTKDE